MSVPSWFEVVLLALAAFRVWRLLAEDTILGRPRAWIVGRVGDYWEAFILCGWCAGFWISLVWWAAWQLWPHATLVAAVPFAVSAIVALVAVNLDPD